MLSLLWIFSVFLIMYGYGFLSRGFTDRHEILRGGSATFQTGLLFWGDSPRDGRVLGVNRGRMVGYALLKHLLTLLLPIPLTLYIFPYWSNPPFLIY